MKLISLIYISLIFYGCSSIPDFLKEDDSIVEEILEDVIERELGISVDLTPNSPEVK